MSLSRQGLTPRLKPLSSRKSATLSVLDIGTSKVVCIVAELQPVDDARIAARAHPSRAHHRHRPSALAGPEGRRRRRSRGRRRRRSARPFTPPSGWPRSRSSRSSSTSRADASARSISRRRSRCAARSVLRRRPPRARRASRHNLRQGRAVLHALPTGFSLDAQHHIVDPAGMIGERLGVDLHVVTSEGAAARNLMLAVERCHLGIEAVIATPYASGLSALVDDEAEMGCAVVDMGGGTTSFGVFARRPSRPCRMRSPSAATTSPWTSRAASRPAYRRPSG